MLSMRSIKRDQMSGFSMIELLVAVLVMGIGVLGITGLQVLSMQNNRAALLRGEAVHMAYDIMDRIRANPGLDYALTMAATPPESPNCLAVSCSAQEMRSFDHRVWKCLLGNFNSHENCLDVRDPDEWAVLPPADQQAGLPAGNGSIEINGSIVTVTVRWQEPNRPEPTSFSVSTQL
jgi:type IV pilus assembly protein PilV